MIETYLINLARFIFATLAFALASIQDWKNRTVSNIIWYAMLIFGIMVLEIEFLLTETSNIFLLTPVPVLSSFLVIYCEGMIFDNRDKKINAAISLSLISISLFSLYVLNLSGDFNNFVKVVDIILMMLLAYVFYRTGVLTGGADAKAMLSLAVLVPSTPYMWDFPVIKVPSQMDVVFPFCLVILLNSAILVLAYPVFLVIYNTYNRNFGFPMWYAYRMNIDYVKKKHVWVTEDIEEGKTVYYLMAPKMDDDDIDKLIKKLKKAGKRKVWVQTKIPFMIPLFFGTIVSFIYGNFILIIIAGLLG